MSEETSASSERPKPRWQPLVALDRRVLGVLVEKAKTTPDGYPMSVNSLRSGCNQKNNRFPAMDVELEDIEESLERLRGLGAVAEVQGGGRVSRFRHYIYDWLGVDKVEAAVMAELLLRGAQTEGELRGRAARMEPIADLSTLRPVLASLKQKGLVLSLTPEGRGHVVTHALYQPRELEKVRAEALAAGPSDATAAAPLRPVATSPAEQPREVPSASHAERVEAQAAASPAAQAGASNENHQYAIAELKAELASVRAELATLRKDLDDLWSNFR
jgi:uncharacterized protein YceH (UPF0502 family)